jgi:hypothetical protein
MFGAKLRMPENQALSSGDAITDREVFTQVVSNG